MNQFIKVIDTNLFLLSKELLGVDEAQLWIGPNPDGPLDNDDQRVLAERAQAEADKNLPGKRISGIEAVTLHESEVYPGWFEVNTTEWQAGTYRFNIHGLANIQTPLGTPLRPIRDGQYSWPQLSDETLQNLPDEQKQFLYLEKNKAGFCIRITITPDRKIESAGDGLTWISQWPELKKITEQHYQEKLQKEIK